MPIIDGIINVIFVGVLSGLIASWMLMGLWGYHE